MAKKKSGPEPYPRELKDKLLAMVDANPDTPVSSLLGAFFSQYPKFKKFKGRLTTGRAHAVIGMLRRQEKKRGVPAPDSERRISISDLPQTSMQYSTILSAASAMQHDGKRPRVILKTLQDRFPTVIFPGARLLMRLFFKNGKNGGVKRTPVKKYAIEGDGFRVEITYHNPKMKAKIVEMIGLLLEG
jgi:hypothetical protein